MVPERRGDRSAAPLFGVFSILEVLAMLRSRVSVLARLLTAVTLTCLVGCPLYPPDDGGPDGGNGPPPPPCIPEDSPCGLNDDCCAGLVCIDGSCAPGNGCGEETYSYHDFTLTKVCTEEDNWCGWADRPGKAVVYGEMSKVVQVPPSCEKLDVTIVIPCNGWGEGLKGRNRSAGCNAAGELK